ncbi:hypothetical protein [Aquibacillus saliphilus]|uniref:hypothetical protein n=1 Tax=Aquibacillus saliphilus TaxID=1909422 RepID=UPI001CF01F2A|nr:hypothetical protein [Aquibacillus saliphilus]
MIKAIGLFIVTLFLSGCFGGDDGISIPLGEDGESISVGGNEEEGFSFEAENADGENFSLNSSTEIPEEFPAEIPLPDDYELINAMKMSDNGDEAVTVSYLTETLSVDELVLLYKGFVDESGYESTSEMITDGYNTLSMQNENDVITINIIPDEDKKQVTVTISYFKSTKNKE